MIPVVYLIFPVFMGGTAIVEHISDSQTLEASKAAAAAGHHDLAKELLCRTHEVRDTEQCKQFKKENKK
jgi:hypothetical protein